MRIPKRRGEQYRQLKQQQDHYLTQAKIDRLQAELQDLIKRQRPIAIAELQRTQEMGDLSENAGYQAAKGILRRMNSRILSLEERIKQAIVIDETDPDGIIRIGSKVTVQVRDTVMSFQILGSQETNPAKGYISHNSPLGLALIGKRAGESVSITAPSGEVTYAITSVS